MLCISKPISAAWTEGASDYNFAAFSLAGAYLSLVFDVAVLCFPLPMVRKLKMPTKRKWQIAGIFWLGGLYVTHDLQAHALSWIDYNS